MHIADPVLPPQMETGISLEEAVAMADADESPLYGYAFSGGNVAGQMLAKTEYKGCVFTHCRFTGAVLSGVWLQNVVLDHCDLSGVNLMEATLQKVRLRGCKLLGANFAAGVLSDTVVENCVAQDASFSETLLKQVLFADSDLSRAAFGDIKRRSVFQFRRCRLTQAEFLHTSLNGQDLTTCDIEGAYFTGSAELRGAKVTALQACELARLLGVIIE